VLLQREFALLHEDFCGIGSGFSDSLALLVGLGLWEAETEDDDQDWWSSAKPEELEKNSQLSTTRIRRLKFTYRSPFMPDGIDESSREDRSKQVSESVTLLEHAGDYTACLFGAIFECCFQSVHCSQTWSPVPTR
jgi:hypothetical protein